MANTDELAAVFTRRIALTVEARTGEGLDGADYQRIGAAVEDAMLAAVAGAGERERMARAEGYTDGARAEAANAEAAGYEQAIADIVRGMDAPSDKPFAEAARAGRARRLGEPDADGADMLDAVESAIDVRADERAVYASVMDYDRGFGAGHGAGYEAAFMDVERGTMTLTVRGLRLAAERGRERAARDAERLEQAAAGGA